MKVPYDTRGETRTPSNPMGYFQAADIPLGGLIQGLNQLAGAFETANNNAKAKVEQTKRFKASRDFIDFTTNVAPKLDDIYKQSNPLDGTLPEHVANAYDNYSEEFIITLPEELQDEFRLRLAEHGQKVKLNAYDVQDKNLTAYQQSEIDSTVNQAKIKVDEDHNSLEVQKALVDELIDSSTYSDTQKALMKQNNAMFLERVAYMKDSQERAIRAKDNNAHVQFLAERGQGREASIERVQKLNPTFSARLAMAIAEGERATGVAAVIRSTSRTKEEQQLYYDRYKAGVAGRAAKPGTNAKHMNGLAADLNDGPVLQWLRANDGENAKRFGIELPFSDDIGHVQMSGAVSMEPRADNWDFQSITKAMWNVESTDGQNMLSPAGAAGFSQVMPDTARELAVKLKDPNFPANGSDEEVQQYLIKNTPTAIRYGEEYFRQMLVRYDGDVELALIAYNGGPGRADTYKTTGDYSALPQETQDYVKKVYSRLGVPNDIDEDPRYQNVPYEDRIAIQADMDTFVTKMLEDEAKQRAAAKTSLVNDLYISLSQGAGQLAMDDAIANGILDDFDARKKAQGIIDDYNKVTYDTNEARRKYNSSERFLLGNEQDQKRANLLFGAEGTEALNNKDVSYLKNNLGPMFTRTGIIARDAIDSLTNGSRSSDGAMMRFANEALNFLQDTNPAAFAAQIPEEVIKRMDRWEALSRIYPEKELLEIMREAPTQEQRNERIALAAQAEKDMVNVNSPGMAFRNFDTVLNLFDTAWFGSPSAPAVPWVKRSMEEDWQIALTEGYITSGGNWEVAAQLAAKTVSRVWSTSTVGGTETVMRNAPEKAYPHIAPEKLTKQLFGELGIPPDMPTQLIADDLTETEINQQREGKGKRPPTYLVAVQRNGYWHVLRNDKGEYLRQNFAPSKAEEALEAAEFEVDKVRYDLRGLPMGGVAPLPEDVQKQIADLEEQLIARHADKVAAEKAVQQQYLTPAEKELETVNEQIAELKSHVDSFTDFAEMETDPKVIEYVRLLDKKAALEVRVPLEQKHKQRFLPRE